MKTVVLCLLVAGALAAPSRKPTFRRGLNRIYGGQEAKPGQFPYQLSLQDTSFGTPNHFCGATIYNKNWAICSAFCVLGEEFDNPGNFQVVAGEHNLDTDEGNEQTIALSKTVQYDGFHPFYLGNDVSLLQLSQPLTFNDHVKAIPLRSDKEFVGNCTVSGWGATRWSDDSSTLQYVDVPTFTDADCRQLYVGDVLDDSMICAGVPEEGKNACTGDNGGPLVCDGHLTGIMSWGYGCSHYPAVYAEVAYFKEWIEENAT